MDRLEGEPKSSCLSSIIRMEGQSQLVRPRDDCPDGRVPIEPGHTVDDMGGLQSDVPGNLSTLFLLHLQVIVDWMQVKVLELDPNLVGGGRLMDTSQSNLVSLSGSSDQPLAIHVWPVLISVAAFPHLRIHLHQIPS